MFQSKDLRPFDAVADAVRRNGGAIRRETDRQVRLSRWRERPRRRRLRVAPGRVSAAASPAAGPTFTPTLSRRRERGFFGTDCK